MKKINITFIAIAIIALHLAALALLIKHQSKNQPSSETTKPINFSPAPVKPVDPFPPLDPTPIEKITPPKLDAIKVNTSAPLANRSNETIARPSSKSGYVSNTLPNRHTSKVFKSLINDPYRSAIVVDAYTGKILYENQATTYAYPASVTKLMTLLIVLEQIKAGAISFEDKVKITREGVSMRNSRPSQVFLDVRESGAFTVHDLLEAVMIHSACDASQVLGIHVAGSRKNFINMMNERAKELGMNATIYHSEHGLPPVDETQADISTAYDTAILCLAVLQHPEAIHYTKTNITYLPKGPIRKERFMLANRNSLIRGEPYQGCDGLKTGYHRIGGWSIAATAKRSGNRVIAIVLGSPDRKTRNATAKILLDKGFKALAQ